MDRSTHDIVRKSKFRHIFGTAEKNDRCFNDIKVTNSSYDNNFCAVNPKFLALAIEGGGGGPFMVVPITQVGRVPINQPVYDGHSAPVNDLAWSPFNDHIIATCSEDLTIKIWVVPEEGLKETTREAHVTFTGHQRKVLIVKWHPVAENVLLSGGADRMIVIWDVGNGCALMEVSCHEDVPLCISWNYDGSLLATTCKDKTLRVIDPRSGTIVSKKEKAHDGTKSWKCVFLKDGRIVTFGFSRMSDRQYKLWNAHDLSEPIISEDIDRENGILFPFYDPDTNLLFAAGRGDSSLKYFEINDDPPFIHYIDVYKSGQQQRGMGWMPKLGCDINSNEIAKFFKIHPTKIEPISFKVPRKSELFQADLYPPTASNEPTLSCEDWWQGTNKNPKLIELRNLFTGPTVGGSNFGAAKNESAGGFGSSGTGLAGKLKSGRVPGNARASPSLDSQNLNRNHNLSSSLTNTNNVGAASHNFFNKPSSTHNTLNNKLTKANSNSTSNINTSKTEDTSFNLRGHKMSNRVKDSPFFGQSDQSKTENSIQTKYNNTTSSDKNGLGEIKRAQSVGQSAACDLASVLPDGMTIQSLLDDVKKMKATIKKQGRRIAFMENKMGIEK